MSLYGTRDAAANFQAEVKKFMTGCGFDQSKYNPSMYYHRKRDIKVLVHGDDFVSVGYMVDIGWFRGVLEGRFEIQTKVVGHDGDLLREARVLNRIIRATVGGWEYEPDQRHAELLVKGLGLHEAKAGPKKNRNRQNRKLEQCRS